MKHPKWRWPWLIALQIAVVSALTALAVLFLAAGPDQAGPVYDLMMWGVVPLSGALTAFFAVRRGVSGILAFWLPPVCQAAVHWLMLGVPPSSVGMPLVAGLVSVVAAATGEELNRRSKKQRHGSKKN